MAVEEAPTPSAPPPPPAGEPPSPTGDEAAAAVPGPTAPRRTTRPDEPEEYTYLTMGSISDRCDKFEEGIKGQSNRELLADFKIMIEGAPTLTLGEEVGDAVKPRNATDAQRRNALEVIVEGMILEKKLEVTRQEEKKMEF